MSLAYIWLVSIAHSNHKSGSHQATASHCKRLLPLQETTPTARGYSHCKRLLPLQEATPTARGYSHCKRLLPLQEATPTARGYSHCKRLLPLQEATPTARGYSHCKRLLPLQETTPTARGYSHCKRLLPLQEATPTARGYSHCKRLLPLQEATPTARGYSHCKRLLPLQETTPTARGYSHHIICITNLLDCNTKLLMEASSVLTPAVQRLDPGVVVATLVSPLLSAVRVHQAGDGAMSLLAVLSRQREVLVTVVSSLLEALEASPQTAAYLCSGVRVVVEEVCDDSTSHPLLCDLVVPKLLQLTVCANPLLAGEEAINHIASIVRTVTRAVDSSFSRGLVDMVVTRMTSSSSSSSFIIIIWVTLRPIGALQSCSPDTAGGDSLSFSWLPPTSGCDGVHTIASRTCYTSCLNKMADGGVLEETLRRDMALVWNCTCSTDLGVVRNAISMATWIAKALVMRGHAYGLDTIHKLFRHGLENEGASSSIVQGFEALFSDQTTMQSHADIKLFYKQRLFEQLLPSVVVAFKEDRPGSREYCLLVLSHLLRSVPQQVVAGELASVLPLLLASLECKDTSLSAIQALTSLIKERPALIGHHVASMFTALVKLSLPPNPLKLRTSSLHCLGLMSTLPHHQVYPYRTMVVQGIAGCLDDHKRVVRKEAINSRSLWLQLGSV
ncbi:hypothetical protein EMCRGX_G028779 [Ephydatia muelleri]